MLNPHVGAMTRLADVAGRENHSTTSAALQG